MLLNFSLVHRRPRPNETRDAVFCHPITERHADIMVRNRKNKRVFNDVSFYLSLKQLENCKSVDITSLVIRHNDYCHGIQATYRVTYMDGTTELREGPKNFFFEWILCLRRRQIEDQRHYDCLIPRRIHPSNPCESGRNFGWNFSHHQSTDVARWRTGWRRSGRCPNHRFEPKGRSLCGNHPWYLAPTRVLYNQPWLGNSRSLCATPKAG